MVNTALRLKTLIMIIQTGRNTAEAATRAGLVAIDASTIDNVRIRDTRVRREENNRIKSD